MVSPVSLMSRIGLSESGEFSKLGESSESDESSA